MRPSALTDLQRQDKVRAFGSSTFPDYETVEAQWTARDHRALGRFVTEQPPYSILVRGIEADLLPMVQRYGRGVLPRSSLAGRWLTVRYCKERQTLASRRAEFMPAQYDLSDPDNRRKLETALASRLPNPGELWTRSISLLWRKADAVLPESIYSPYWNHTIGHAF